MNHARTYVIALVVVAAGGLGWWLYARRQAVAPDISGDASPAPPASAGDEFSVSGLGYAVVDAVTGWQARGAPYRDTIYAAAQRNGVPGDLLFRVAYQESRFRDDIISGATTSSVGAQGMFQFMPATAASLGVNPLDVGSAADGAARYLAQLYRQFGTWALALTAYNFGPGNTRKYLAGTKTLPTETQNYVAQITSDVGYA